MNMKVSEAAEKFLFINMQTVCLDLWKLSHHEPLVAIGRSGLSVARYINDMGGD